MTVIGMPSAATKPTTSAGTTRVVRHDGPSVVSDSEGDNRRSLVSLTHDTPVSISAIVGGARWRGADRPRTTSRWTPSAHRLPRATTPPGHATEDRDQH